jgi:hypothetical protein
VNLSYKRLNVENAVKRSLGVISASQQVNRLIPMFSMRSTLALLFLEDTGGDSGGELGWSKDEPSGTFAIDSWLFTSSAQVAIAAITGDLSYTGNQDANNDFGTEQKTEFKAGLIYGTGGSLPGYRFTQWGFASSNAQLPSSSFYLFSTESRPSGMPTSTQLVPLWRLSTQCVQIRKYTYTTSDSERSSLTNSGTSGGDTTPANCIPNSSRRFWEDGIEGYVLSEQLPGTVPLYRVAQFTGATSSVALSTKSPDDLAAFSGMSDLPLPSGTAILGYVYPTDVVSGSNPRTLRDTDGDSLEDRFEQVMGLNEQLTDSDCDGSADAVEFPLNEISPSDPMTATSNCFDSRTQFVQRASPSSSTIDIGLRNVGPVSSISYGYANEVMVFFESVSTVMSPSSIPSVCRLVENRASVPPYRVWLACEVGALAPSLSSSWQGSFTISGASVSDLAVTVDIPTSQDDVPSNNVRTIALP